MKIALVLCSDMHMDIDKANTLIEYGAKHEWCTNYKEADTIIIMTCAFGTKKNYSMFAIADVLKNAKPEAQIIATGCLVKLARTELEAIPRLEVKTFDEVLQMLSSAPSSSELPQVVQKIRQNTVIISSGCLKKCSYCVYPLIEGKYKSKPIEDILSEISIMSQTEPVIYISGAQETSDYGIDLYGSRKFAYLLEQIVTRFPNQYFVIGWFNPDRLSDDVIDIIKKFKNIIHIMLHMQHNDNGILRNMHRPCIELTESKIKKLRSVRPDIQISTEVIVGFPGETEEIFNRLVSYLEENRKLFCDIGVASYEPVMGTSAALLPNLPEYSVKQKRMEIIQKRFNASAYPAPEDFKPLLSSFFEACHILATLK